jgi:hypothetical protein
MSRIRLDDTVVDTIVKLAEGITGAMRVLTDIVRSRDNGVIHILKFDDLGIYGSRIWLAYKDVMGEDDDAFFQALKNNTLGERIKDKCSSDNRFKSEWEDSMIQGGNR